MSEIILKNDPREMKMAYKSLKRNFKGWIKVVNDKFKIGDKVWDSKYKRFDNVDKELIGIPVNESFIMYTIRNNRQS